MEHRYNSRVFANIKLLIFSKGLPIATGRIRNISKSGIFVETDHRDAKICQPLDVEVLSRLLPVGQRLRFKATVAHQAHDGYGLELAGQSDAVTALIAMIDNDAMFDAGAIRQSSSAK